MRQFNIAVLLAFAVLLAIIAAALLGPDRATKTRPEVPKTNCPAPGYPADHFEWFTKCADWRKG